RFELSVHAAPCPCAATPTRQPECRPTPTGDSVLDSLETRVIAEVNNRFADTVELLRALVRQPSVLGSELGAQQVVARRLQDLGLAPDVWDLDSAALKQHPQFGPLDIDYIGRPNVTARWAAAGAGGRSLILNGHIDVVPPEPMANWSRDPW